MIERLIEAGPDAPGLAVLVTHGGEIVARRVVGLANLEHRVPIGAQTRFHIVSVSKTFMAAAILILRAEGRLGLDDPIRRYIPELPDAIDGQGAVTIRHLLSLTSGLRDVFEIARLRGLWHAAPERVGDLLALAFRQSAVSAPASAQYLYTNVNHLLLDELVTRVAGMPAEDFRRRAIYAPLGLTETGARASDALVLPGLADPYVPDGAGGWNRAVHLLGIAGDVLTSSLDDLGRWVLALRNGAIGGVAITAAMATPQHLATGRALHYGLGLALRRYRGLAVYCHSGSQPGYKAHIAYIPDRDLGLAILSNREDTQPSILAARLFEAFLDAGFPTPHPATEARQRLDAAGFSQAELARIDGHYVDAEASEWAMLGLMDGVLECETLGDPLTLYHAAGGIFRDGDDYRATVPAELRLVFGSVGGDVTAELDLGGQRMRLKKVDPPHYDPTALAAFAGRYESAEIDSRHTVGVGDDRLVIDYGLGGDRDRRFAMQPVAPDMFLARPRAPGIYYKHLFRFERDTTGAVIGALVTMERLKGIRLRRV
ncbi:MAG: hypothetical protein EXQ87_12385 [Alphaproteobacteria bacterium]|nr:hypothetical protein [Alphaproteobacteria bacterium]